MLLTIDIGGTNTRLATIRNHSAAIRLNHFRTYKSRDYSNIEAIVRDFEASSGVKARIVVIGVPGPVADGAAKATNLPWRLEEKRLAGMLDFSSVTLVNDVEALGHSIAALGPDDFEVLHKGRHYPDTPIAVIAPGTGLGKSFLLRVSHDYRVFSSEGGHVAFAPANALELELLDYLLERYSHVSCERVCSGPGILNIYKFLKDRKICVEPAWLHETILNSDDPPQVISQNALAGNKAESISIKTLDMFISILGSTAGNMAMMLNAKNGLVVGGGIAPKIVPLLKKKIFMNSFLGKGSLAEFISDVPVKVIRRPEANLYGLAQIALRISRNGSEVLNAP